MSRKDYVAIAAALHSTRPIPGSAQAEQWINDVSEIARVLSSDNVRFDYTRFLAATEGK